MNQQKVLNFKFDNSYNEKDFILDSSNEKALLFFNKFPDWENKLINLVGSEKSGKTFLLKILNKKNDFYYLNTFPENNEEFDKLFNFERFLLDLNELDELKFFSILNHCIINDKYLVVTSLVPLQTHHREKRLCPFLCFFSWKLIYHLCDHNILSSSKFWK